MTKLSVVIITKNEEENIARCIASCQPLGAEIIVLDSHSTDKTATIAENLGAQVYAVEWKGYGATKNEGAALAKHDWILSLDADEAIDEQLQNSIKEAMLTEKKVAAYWISRCLIFRGQTMRHGAVKNESRLRLYHKNKMQWNLEEVHETLEFRDANKRAYYGTLEGGIAHNSYRNLEDMHARLDHYARLGAKKIMHKGKLYLALKKLIAPSFSFIKNYVFKKGYADGAQGKLFAQAQARYVYNKYAFALKEKNKD